MLELSFRFNENPYSLIRLEATENDSTPPSLNCGPCCAEDTFTRSEGISFVMKLVDITGNRFGRWLVLGKSGAIKGHVLWKCRCDCGSENLIPGANLKRGLSLSCGCYARELKAARATTHGMTRTPEYLAWRQMRVRCAAKDGRWFLSYGAKGIKVCDRWAGSFQNFYEDVGPRPSKNHSLGRINNDLGYCPENCRWETRSQQMRNRSCAKLLTLNGETLCVAEWSERTGILPCVLYSRAEQGWSDKDTLTRPVRKW